MITPKFRKDGSLILPNRESESLQLSRSLKDMEKRKKTLKEEIKSYSWQE